MPLLSCLGRVNDCIRGFTLVERGVEVSTVAFVEGGVVMGIEIEIGSAGLRCTRPRFPALHLVDSQLCRTVGTLVASAHSGKGAVLLPDNT